MSESCSMTLLQVKDLYTYYHTKDKTIRAVDGVSFELEKGHTVGLVGESGCGKTTIALSITSLLPATAEIQRGEIFFNGRDLLKLGDVELRKYRWKEISIVLQGAMNALNPVFTIEKQIIEAITIHEKIELEEARARVARLLKLVGMAPEKSTSYPFELSGGMKQRAMIAMALSLNPQLIIADEPTTALDVIVQSQIIDLLLKLKEELDLSIIWVSHDLALVATIADEVVVVYAGKVMERGPAVEIYTNPAHPYAQKLIESVPNILAPKTIMTAIPGAPPDLSNPPSGCRFHHRCDKAFDKCRCEEPQLIEVGTNHYVACHTLET